MKIKKQASMVIERSYKITSKELKKTLGVEGEVLNINLWQGRSPNDIEQGISADEDKWEISTREVKEKENK